MIQENPIIAGLKTRLIKAIKDKKSVLSDFEVSQPIVRALIADLLVDEEGLKEIVEKVEAGEYLPEIDDNGHLLLAEFAVWQNIETIAEVMYESKHFNHIAFISEDERNIGQWAAGPRFSPQAPFSLQLELAKKLYIKPDQAGYEMSLYDIGDVYQDGKENVVLCITYKAADSAVNDIVELIQKRQSQNLH